MIQQYIILAIDDNDQTFKLIDFYPTIEERSCIGILYILSYPEKFSFNNLEIEKLNKVYHMK